MTKMPPGPAESRAFATLRWLVRPEAQLHRAHARYGDTFTLRMPFGDAVVVCAPEAIKEVFTGDPDVFRAGEGNAPLEPVLGPSSVLLLDGPAHLRQRRLLLPPFHGERLAGWTATMAEIAAADVARWPAGEPFALEDRTRAITLEIILRVVFGLRDGARLDELRSLFPQLVPEGLGGRLAMLPALRRGTRGPWGRFLAVRGRIDALLLDEIARRRTADDEERDDVLSLLLATDLTDAELRDELMTLLLAGHETTATSLAWTVELLLRHPAWHERALDELDDDATLDAIATEALRLRPPLPMVMRRLAAPATVAGHALPAGTRVAPCIWLAHRRAQQYPDPHAFRPERFLGGQKVETYAFLPFGGGIRRCVGASFAQTELRVVLRELLRGTQLEPVTPRPERSRRRAIVLGPRHGALVRARAGAPRPAVAAG